ncbi:ABC transporter substrate-binding protein [Bordetella sp. BOR01]|uniref:ABC transporter substrate-binding protein n=1 Tax=Bordetella sp. BOR01 TaxID=2854779 RepID=UPI001C474233|nr:ABC transporter substrate-binding protein [Bordetella sp. BOR01]MBV7482030.1 ABC transporter substrate-binding protein [Bordetella sp. BOR01]
MHSFLRIMYTAGAALCLAGTAAAADTTLRVGYLRTQGYIADFPLAQVSVPGVKLELIPLETGNDVLEALNANAIDVGETGEVQPIFAQSGKRPVRVIAATAPQTAATAILVAKDSPIQSVADLKGRKVSFTQGTNTHWLLLQTLATAGLKQSDITPVLLGSADAGTALNSGKLDAAIVTAPTIQILQSKGARVLVDGKGLVNSSLYYLANTPTIAGPKRAALEGFVRALDQHLTWIQNHLDERAAYLSPKYGIPVPLVRAASGVMVDRLVPVGDGALAAYTQRIADAFAEQKLIPGRVDARQEFDGAFDGVLRQGGQ